MYDTQNLLTFNALFVLQLSIVTFLFDKTKGKLIRERKSLFNTKTIEYPLNEISNVQIESMNARGSTHYRATIILKSGKELPLTESYSSDISRGEEKVKLIKNFLNSI